MKERIRRLMLVTGFAIGVARYAGAAEYYVATHGTGAGTSWAAAFTNVQDAFDIAGANATIYVAGGDYVLTNQLIWPAVSGVTLSGGYEGVGTPGSNNPALWPTRFTRDTDVETRILAIENVATGRLERVILSDGILVSPQFKGGNLYLNHVTNFTVSNVVIQRASARSTANSQNFVGGGVAMEQCAGIVFDACAIEDNRLTGTHYGGNQRGAGLYAINSDFLVTNSNQGLFLTPDDAGFLVRNTIVWGHADDIGNVPESRIRHSCAANLTPQVQGNINIDPLFVDTDVGDYRLLRSVDLISPAINSGQNQLWMIGAIDLEGNRRVMEGRVDMGAFESIPPRGTLIMIW